MLWHPVMQNNDVTSDDVNRAITQGKETIEELKARALEIKDEAVSRGNDVLSQLTGEISAHPFKAVAIAFGLGYFGLFGGILGIGFLGLFGNRTK